MRKMKDSGIEWIGEIPEDWEVVRGKTLFTQRNTKGNSVEVHLAATQLKGMYPQNELEGVVQVKLETDLQTFKTVHKNDFVISLRSFQGGFEMSDYEGVCSPAYQVFYNRESIYHQYFKRLFKSDGFISKMNSLTVGIREGKNIQFADFVDSLLPLPPLPTQHRIASYLDRKCTKIDAIIEREQSVIDKLKEYKQSVITEAVTKGLDPKVKMKDSGVEWIGEIPETSIITRAGHLYSIILGKMLSTKQNKDTDTLEEYFCAANVHFSGIDYYNLKKMWFTENERYTYKVKKGDLLVVEGGAGAGGSYIIKNDISNCYIQNSIMIVRELNYISNKWLFYTLYSLVNRNYIDFVCNKATIPHFTKDKLSNVPVVVFPQEEIDALCGNLDKMCLKIDSAIEKKQSVIDKLTEYKKSLIYEVVTGKMEV